MRALPPVPSRSFVPGSPRPASSRTPDPVERARSSNPCCALSRLDPQAAAGHSPGAGSGLVWLASAARCLPGHFSGSLLFGPASALSFCNCHPATPACSGPPLSLGGTPQQNEPGVSGSEVMPTSDWDPGFQNEDVHPSEGRNSAPTVNSSAVPSDPPTPSPSMMGSLGSELDVAARGAAAEAREQAGTDALQSLTLMGSTRSTGSTGSGQPSLGEEGSRLLFDVGSDKEPVVYSRDYDVTFMGLEKLHPFDSTKWKRVLEFLVAGGRITRGQVVAPKQASEADLLTVHSQEYLKSLQSSLRVAEIAELPFLAMMPNALIQRHLLKPFKFQVGGSVLAAKLALERGWAFNIGGGFHHACAHSGGGFCAYADITILIKVARMHLNVDRVMIVDLDAHQGNGHERDFLGDTDAPRTYIFDMYNVDIYPQDHRAKAAINLKVELRSGTGTKEYLNLLQEHLQIAFSSFSPSLVVYNAGTDVLDQDPLGRLRISASGVVERDEMVFAACRKAGVPVVMLTSGGYQRNNAEIIADSIGNLADKGLISLQAKEIASL